MSSKTRDQQPTPELPQSLEAERTLLGYYLQGGAWRDDIDARHFALEKHQTLWHSMQAIHQAGDGLDVKRLAVELGEKKLKHVGLGYLTDLGDGCYPEMKVEPYVAKLHDAATRRDVVHHAHILMTHASSGDRSADELLEMATTAFSRLEPGRGNGAFTYADVPSIWTWEASVEWVVEDLIPEGGITLITGDSGHGKTIFATAMAGAIASGCPFLGRPTRKRKVVYLDRENPAGVVKQHLHDLGIEPTENLIVWGNWCGHEADGPQSASLLKLARAEKPVLIFDPAIAFHPGDEQSSTETRAFMQHCRKLAAAGASPALLHHVGKGENAKMYRGSSDYKAAVDIAFLLEKLGDPAGPLSELRLVPFKNRFGGSATVPLSFRNGTFLAGQRGETCEEIMERLVHDNPGESPRPLIELARSEGMSKHQAEQQLSRGVKQGRFEVRKAGRTRGYYLREGDLEGL